MVCLPLTAPPTLTKWWNLTAPGLPVHRQMGIRKENLRDYAIPAFSVTNFRDMLKVSSLKHQGEKHKISAAIQHSTICMRAKLLEKEVLAGHIFNLFRPSQFSLSTLNIMWWFLNSLDNLKFGVGGKQELFTSPKPQNIKAALFFTACFQPMQTRWTKPNTARVNLGDIYKDGTSWHQPFYKLKAFYSTKTQHMGNENIVDSCAGHNQACWDFEGKKRPDIPIHNSIMRPKYLNNCLARSGGFSAWNKYIIHYSFFIVILLGVLFCLTSWANSRSLPGLLSLWVF